MLVLCGGESLKGQSPFDPGEDEMSDSVLGDGVCFRKADGGVLGDGGDGDPTVKSAF